MTVSPLRPDDAGILSGPPPGDVPLVDGLAIEHPVLCQFGRRPEHVLLP
jgi:hypothetical protein